MPHHSEPPTLMGSCKAGEGSRSPAPPCGHLISSCMSDLLFLTTNSLHCCVPHNNVWSVLIYVMWIVIDGWYLADSEPPVLLACVDVPHSEVQLISSSEHQSNKYLQGVLQH